jgi:hypothetical protein
MEAMSRCAILGLSLTLFLGASTLAFAEKAGSTSGQMTSSQNIQDRARSGETSRTEAAPANPCGGWLATIFAGWNGCACSTSSPCSGLVLGVGF